MKRNFICLVLAGVLTLSSSSFVVGEKTLDVLNVIAAIVDVVLHIL